MSQQLQARQYTAAVARAMAPLPDKGQWVNRFEVGSRTDPDKNYVIAQNAEHRHWGCSCMGWRTRRRCKHLDALGLPTGEVAYELPDLPATGNTGDPVIDYAINNLGNITQRAVPQFVPAGTRPVPPRSRTQLATPRVDTAERLVPAEKKERRFLLD